MHGLDDPLVQRVLDRLHASSDAQSADIATYEEARKLSADPQSEAELRLFRSDKLVALDRDKAEFCYQLCRAMGARHVVEIGSSFGVSTIYLAAAVRANIEAGGGTGIVVGTEYEPRKAATARGNFAAAGVADLVDLREGDFRDTLCRLPAAVDFALIDIWIRYARRAIEIVYPHLRPGAVVICDNTHVQRSDYADYLSFVGDPAKGFRTMTLPFRGGLEFSVYRGA